MTPKTLFITSNKVQRHEHVLIRSGTYFIKAIDSEECFGGRGSVATISDSFWTSCSIEQKERKRRSHLYSKRCSRASSESERERTTNDNAHQESTRYEPHVSPRAMRCLGRRPRRGKQKELRRCDSKQKKRRKKIKQKQRKKQKKKKTFFCTQGKKKVVVVTTASFFCGCVTRCK